MRLGNPASIVAAKKWLALVDLEKESTTAGIREDADGEIVKPYRDRHISCRPATPQRSSRTLIFIHDTHIYSRAATVAVLFKHTSGLLLLPPPPLNPAILHHISSVTNL